jgi:hypothetical protein
MLALLGELPALIESHDCKRRSPVPALPSTHETSGAESRVAAVISARPWPAAVGQWHGDDQEDFHVLYEDNCRFLLEFLYRHRDVHRNVARGSRSAKLIEFWLRQFAEGTVTYPISRLPQMLCLCSLASTCLRHVVCLTVAHAHESGHADCRISSPRCGLYLLVDCEATLERGWLPGKTPDVGGEQLTAFCKDDDNLLARQCGTMSLDDGRIVPMLPFHLVRISDGEFASQSICDLCAVRKFCRLVCVVGCAIRPSTHACHAFLPIGRNGGCAAGNSAGEVGQKSIPATSDLGRIEQDRDSWSWSRISGGRVEPVKPYVVTRQRSRSRATSGSGSAWEGRSPFCPVRYICSSGWSATGAIDGAGARDCDR